MALCSERWKRGTLALAKSKWTDNWLCRNIGEEQRAAQSALGNGVMGCHKRMLSTIYTAFEPEGEEDNWLLYCQSNLKLLNV